MQGLVNFVRKLLSNYFPIRVRIDLMKRDDNELFPREVVIVFFYDKNLNLLVQRRRSHSKVGEKYGFFGGGIEEGESAEQALRR